MTFSKVEARATKVKKVLDDAEARVTEVEVKAEGVEEVLGEARNQASTT